MAKETKSKGGDPKVAERLVLLREALGYSQSEFAAFLGHSGGQTRLSNWERNAQQLPNNQALIIRRKTGASLDWLYEGDESGLPARLHSLLTNYRRTPRAQ